MEKKLYRSRTNRTFSGVCGGLGKYLNIDATIVRVLWVIISVFTAGFTGLIVYLILMAVIPEEPEGYEDVPPYQAPYQPPEPPPYQPPEEAPLETPENPPEN